jgi:hypothetical protein
MVKVVHGDHGEEIGNRWFYWLLIASFLVSGPERAFEFDAFWNSGISSRMFKINFYFSFNWAVCVGKCIVLKLGLDRWVDSGSSWLGFETGLGLRKNNISQKLMWSGWPGQKSGCNSLIIYLFLTKIISFWFIKKLKMTRWSD